MEVLLILEKLLTPPFLQNVELSQIKKFGGYHAIEKIKRVFGSEQS